MKIGWLASAVGASLIAGGAAKADGSYYVVNMTKQSAEAIDFSTTRVLLMNIRSALTTVIYPSPRVLGDKLYQIAVVSVLYDCENHTFKETHLKLMNIDGVSLGEDDYAGKWDSADAASLNRIQENLVCLGKPPPMATAYDLNSIKLAYLKMLENGGLSDAKP